MKTFEIHITGDVSILDWCKENNLKSLILDLCNDIGHTIRTEYMTSIVKQFPDYISCKEFVLDLADKARIDGIKVVRTKIESPVYPEYEEQSLYMETHFPICGFTFEDESDLKVPSRYPASLNINKYKWIGTDREYRQSLYKYFQSKHKERNHNEFELCLYDDNIQEDSDWLSLWGK